jgi:hypothetical protein
MKAQAVIAAMLAMTAGPALAQAPQGLMPLYGVTVSAAGVTVRVPASACLHKSDFTVAVLKREPQSMVLFTPKRPQGCGLVGPGHTDLTYALDDLGLKPGEGFILGNPLAAEP